MTSESLESLPCPLCGGPAELWRASGTAPPRPAFIGCLGRCCVLVSREYATDAEAVAAWNTRTPQGVASAAANPNASDAPAQGVDVGKLREVLTSAQSELADCCAGNKWREHQTLADVRRALEILATPSSEGEGASEAAKVAAYEDAHATAVDLGYPSITEALETLDATHSPVSPAIGGEVELRDMLAAAYEQGCIDTHNSIQAEPELALMAVEHAEFGEAAGDYAISALSALSPQGVQEAVGGAAERIAAYLLERDQALGPYEEGPAGDAERLESARAILFALAEASPLPLGWQPIETAPKDMLLLLWGCLDPHEKDRGLYSNLDKPCRAAGYWDSIDGAWCVAGSTWLGPWIKATRWMPLPSVPEGMK